MNILVIGCRRVGSNLARVLDLAGHDVSVLAENKADLSRMYEFTGYTFGGMTFTGIPVDTDALKAAGIESMDAVTCVTADDNINLMAAQIAKEIFSVPQVVCRVADPVTKDIYSERFGLRVLCPTNLTVEAFADSLQEDPAACAVTFGSSTLGFSYTDVPSELCNKPITLASPMAGKQLVGVLRANQRVELASEPGLQLYNGDKLVWAELQD